MLQMKLIHLFWQPFKFFLQPTFSIYVFGTYPVFPNLSSVVIFELLLVKLICFREIYISVKKHDIVDLHWEQHSRAVFHPFVLKETAIAVFDYCGLSVKWLADMSISPCSLCQPFLCNFSGKYSQITFQQKSLKKD